MEQSMGEIRDQRRAVALVATILLTAGMFAGFAFGTTAHDIDRHPTPLLLQSGVQVQRVHGDCERPPVVRQVNLDPRTASDHTARTPERRPTGRHGA